MVFFSYVICIYFMLELRDAEIGKDHTKLWSIVFASTLFITLLFKPNPELFLIYSDLGTFGHSLDLSFLSQIIIAVCGGFYYYFSSKLLRKMTHGVFSSEYMFYLMVLLPAGVAAVIVMSFVLALVSL